MISQHRSLMALFLFVATWISGWSATVPSPLVLPGSGAYRAPLVVVAVPLSRSTTLRYTTDCSAVTEASPVLARVLILGGDTQLRVQAFRPGWSPSAVLTRTYQIQGGALAVSAPQFTPPGGIYAAPQLVQLSVAEADARIHIRRDGGEPTTADPQYSEPLLVDASTTITAKAYRLGLIGSSVTRATYTIEAMPPSVAPVQISPMGGAWTGSVAVTLSTTTPGAQLHYRLDDQPPTTADPIATGPILITATTTLSARAVAPGWSPSPVAQATLTILPLPTLSLTAAAAEVAESAGQYPVSVALDAASTYPVTATLRVSAGGQVLHDLPVLITAGATIATIAVPITDDDLDNDGRQVRGTGAGPQRGCPRPGRAGPDPDRR